MSATIPTVSSESKPPTSLRRLRGGICAREECLDAPRSRGVILPTLDRLDGITSGLIRRDRWKTTSE